MVLDIIIVVCSRRRIKNRTVARDNYVGKRSSEIKKKKCPTIAENVTSKKKKKKKNERKGEPETRVRTCARVYCRARSTAAVRPRCWRLGRVRRTAGRGPLRYGPAKTALLRAHAHTLAAASIRPGGPARINGTP